MGSLFALVPTALVRDATLTTTARLVAVVIASYAGRERESWPSRRTIAEGAGVSVDTVDSAIGALIAAGYVERVHRYDSDGAQRSSLYRIVYSEATVYGESVEPSQSPGGAAPVRRGGPHQFGGGGRTSSAQSVPVDQDQGTVASSSSSARETFSATPPQTPPRSASASDRIAALMGELGDDGTEAWRLLSLSLRSQASREAVAQSLLGAVSGLGVAEPVAPAHLASGILAALGLADRPSTRLILGCARSEARGPAPGHAERLAGTATTPEDPDDPWSAESLHAAERELRRGGRGGD